jgi:hypothetical protein
MMTRKRDLLTLAIERFERAKTTRERDAALRKLSAAVEASPTLTPDQQRRLTAIRDAMPLRAGRPGNHERNALLLSTMIALQETFQGSVGRRVHSGFAAPESQTNEALRDVISKVRIPVYAPSLPDDLTMTDEASAIAASLPSQSKRAQLSAKGIESALAVARKTARKIT